MTEGEAKNLVEIYIHSAVELESNIRAKFSSYKALSLEELEALYVENDSLRHAASGVYAACLGLAGRVKDELDKRKGKVVTQVESPKVTTALPATAAAPPFPKKKPASPPAIDLVALAKQLSGMKLTADDLMKVREGEK